MPPVNVPDGKLQPTKRATGLTCLQTYCLHWHFLWVEVGSFCGPGLGATTAVQWRGKGRGPGMRPFTNGSVYRRLAWCLAGVLYGSLRAPLKILPPFALGLPPRERSVGSKDTLHTCQAYQVPKD